MQSTTIPLAQKSIFQRKRFAKRILPVFMGE
jgi:hypothetical protein